MGNRLTKIFTRKGDDGSTDLGNNKRVPKYDQQIEVFGSLDELSASIGILITSKDLPPRIVVFLTEVQQNIFNLSGEIAAPEFSNIDAANVLALENLINDLNATLPPLKDFVLPGSTRAAAHCHQARAICRRAERQLCKLAEIHQSIIRCFVCRCPNLGQARKSRRNNLGSRTNLDCCNEMAWI